MLGTNHFTHTLLNPHSKLHPMTTHISQVRIQRLRGHTTSVEVLK